MVKLTHTNTDNSREHTVTDETTEHTNTHPSSYTKALIRAVNAQALISRAVVGSTPVLGWQRCLHCQGNVAVIGARTSPCLVADSRTL